MRTRLTGCMVCVMLLAFCLPVHAQKIPRIGVLRAGAPPTDGDGDPSSSPKPWLCGR